MSSQVKTCSLHIDVKTTDPVEEFVQSTWHKMKAAEEARRKSLKTCYKNFTAINAKQDTQESPAPAHHLHSATSSETQVSGTGIFPKTCLFCKQKWKSCGRNKPLEDVGGL